MLATQKNEHKRTSGIRAPERRQSMKPIRNPGALAALIAVIINSAACSDMSPRARDTAIGAGVGAAAGAAIGGNALSTVGGAAAGGLIGNQLGK
jgi:osmotically inducible lipoprotein OsmB